MLMRIHGKAALQNRGKRAAFQIMGHTRSSRKERRKREKGGREEERKGGGKYPLSHIKQKNKV